MKIILGIFCGLMLLFAGGCAFILLIGSGFNGMFQSMPAALMTGGIAALNMLVLITLFSSAKKHVWAFHVLAGLDLLAVAILMIMWVSVGFNDSEVNTIGTILVAGLGLKAALTFIAAKKA